MPVTSARFGKPFLSRGSREFSRLGSGRRQRVLGPLDDAGIDPVAEQHHACGEKQDLEVEPERGTPDIPEVQRQLRLATDELAAMNLGPTGNAGPHRRAL